MSATLTVQTEELQSFQAELAQLGTIGSTGQVLEAMGGGVKGALIDHFTQLDQDELHHQSSSSLGAGRSHFYGRVAKGVQNPQIEGSDSVSVSINNVGIAQRYFGGVIAATNKQWITIPAVADAYGKPAGSFNNLRFVLFRPDLAALIERLPVTTGSNGVIKGSGTTAEKGRVVFWLKKEVTQHADPTVLPTDDEMSARALEAGREALAQLKVLS